MGLPSKVTLSLFSSIWYDKSLITLPFTAILPSSIRLSAFLLDAIPAAAINLFILIYKPPHFKYIHKNKIGKKPTLSLIVLLLGSNHHTTNFYCVLVVPAD